MEEHKLPNSWIWTTIEELAINIQYGYTESAKDEPVGPKFLRITDIQEGWVDWDAVPFCICSEEDISKYLLQSNDIVFARTGATTGKSYLIKDCPKAVFASYLIRLRFENPIDIKFIAMFLNSPMYWSQIMTVRKGSAQPGVNATTLATIKLPLAPFVEQQRIVAAIEQQFTRLDAGVAALKSAQTRLKRYRAAVLKAAVEGKLTEAWRTEHPTNEPASVLLERILVERRAKWEADLRAKGKDLTKVKYVEPAAPDVSGLSELPEGWCWTSVETISTKVVDGVHKKPDYISIGVPFVTVRNLTAGPGISFEHLNYITQEDHIEFCKRAKPEKGDVLITKDGTLGVVRVINTDMQFSIFVSVALIKPVLRDMSNYLELSLSSSPVQVQMVPKGSGLQHIHLEDLRADCIPLPPIGEQYQIVAEVERRLSVVSQLEAIVEANLKRAERMRQSILKEAFAGRLVPQNPDDEPASVLLERIRQERKAHSEQKQGKQHSRQGNGKKTKEKNNPKRQYVTNALDQEPEHIDISDIEQVALWNGVAD